MLYKSRLHDYLMATTMKFLLKTFTFFFFINNSFAQIAAPNLRCATTRFNGDVELTWQLPTVGCGAINAYKIWAKPAGGSFSLLATITNTAQISYTHIGANGNNSQWFYYLETDANCIGQLLAQSDTLDNRPPLPPVINNVSVVNGKIVLSWNAGTDPETYSYIVYNATTNTAIDTVFGRNNTQFTDLSATNVLGNYDYTLVTMDTCFNAGIRNVLPQHNLVLNTTINRCEQSAKLSWNAYDNWANGVLRYEIWSGINGANPVKTDTVAGDILTYTNKNLTDGANTCFIVKAIAKNTNYTAVSNANCVTINIVKPTKFVYLKNVTVNADNTVGLDWQWNTDIDLDSYGINSATDNNTYQRFSVLSAQLPLVLSNHTDVVFQDIDKNKLYYKIETIDSCKQLVFSNYVATVFAKVTALEGFTNKISWTAYDNPYGTIQYYEVFRNTTNGNSVKVATVNGNTLSADDRLNPQNASEQDACYYVVGYANLRLPVGLPANVASRSNTVCAHQSIDLLLPNAFAPEGNNTVFKPAAVFTNSATYSMQIFDRWGGKLFETSDVNTGWDGTANGRPMPQGVYVYVIKAKEPDKNAIEKRGSVFLLR